MVKELVLFYTSWDIGNSALFITNKKNLKMLKTNSWFFLYRDFGNSENIYQTLTSTGSPQVSTRSFDGTIK